MPQDELAILEREITNCRKCPRLVPYREEVARTKRRAYRDWTYWGRPVPAFGDPEARLVIIGLAPARARGQPHGANVYRGPLGGFSVRATLSARGSPISRNRSAPMTG